MELCLRPGGWLSALARLFAAEDPAPQSRAQARPEVNARAEKLLDAYGAKLMKKCYLKVVVVLIHFLVLNGI